MSDVAIDRVSDDQSRVAVNNLFQRMNVSASERVESASKDLAVLVADVVDSGGEETKIALHPFYDGTTATTMTALPVSESPREVTGGEQMPVTDAENVSGAGGEVVTSESGADAPEPSNQTTSRDDARVSTKPVAQREHSGSGVPGGTSTLDQMYERAKANNTLRDITNRDTLFTQVVFEQDGVELDRHQVVVEYTRLDVVDVETGMLVTQKVQDRPGTVKAIKDEAMRYITSAFDGRIRFVEMNWIGNDMRVVKIECAEARPKRVNPRDRPKPDRRDRGGAVDRGRDDRALDQVQKRVDSASSAPKMAEATPTVRRSAISVLVPAEDDTTLAHVTGDPKSVFVGSLRGVHDSTVRGTSLAEVLRRDSGDDSVAVDRFVMRFYEMVNRYRREVLGVEGVFFERSHAGSPMAVYTAVSAVQCTPEALADEWMLYLIDSDAEDFSVITDQNASGVKIQAGDFSVSAEKSDAGVDQYRYSFSCRVVR